MSELFYALRDVMDMQYDYAADQNTWCLPQVLFNATSFPGTGQVILHRGSRQHLYAAKRLFEDFFRLIEAMNAKDDIV